MIYTLENDFKMLSHYMTNEADGASDNIKKVFLCFLRCQLNFLGLCITPWVCLCYDEVHVF